ncbi:MAG: PAS domain-containing protein [Campylobacterales bacterium]
MGGRTGLAFGFITAIWTIIVLSLFFAGVRDRHGTHSQLAVAEARSSYNKDVAYRQWGTHHGGVYVPITATTPPNPNLSHIKDRDVNTTGGKQLTLVNPAYMTRQVHELPETQYGIKGKLTSLKPVRALNAPDEWEAAALEKLKAGRADYFELTGFQGEPHLRYMGPMIASENCLKCHRTQGYQTGDVIGGVSIAVPWRGYADLAAKENLKSALAYAALWLFGLTVLGGSYLYLQREIEALKRRETLWHEALEGAQQGVWEWNPKTGEIHYSDRYKALIGYAPHELEDTYEAWESRVHPDDLPEADKQIRRCTQGGEARYENEHRLRCKDGHYKWVLDRGSVMERDEAGRVTRMVGTLADVSLHHELLLRANEAQQRAQLYLQLVDVMIVALDQDGTVRLVNPAAARLVGLEEADIVGQPWFDRFLPEGQREQVKAVFAQEVWEKRQEPLLYENPILTASGEERLISWRSTAIFDAAGNLAGVLAAGTDITEEREARRALEKLNAELEERVVTEVTRRQESERTMLHQSRVAAMGEMITAIAHHWRQPLNVVALEVQGLRDELRAGTLDETRLETMIEKSMGKIREMSDTIDSLRGLIATESQKQQCCVLEELQQAHQLLKAELEVENIRTVAFCFEEDAKPLPACRCQPQNAKWVRIIPADFRQAVFNILINARDAIKERRKKNGGPETGQITVRLLYEEGFERVEIEDNGGGFAPGAIEHIFDPFFTTKERGRGEGLITGVGLGLYLTKMVVEERMGGTISAENAAEGARIVIRLPLEKKA